MKRFLPLPAIGLLVAAAYAAEPLPSWNDTASKRAIVDFVEQVTSTASPKFVPVGERIAVFDNDGTLWCEQPIYVQAIFTFDRVRQLAAQHPEWSQKQPFAAVLKKDIKAVLDGGDRALLELIMATHADLSTDEFERIVSDWIATARHPTTGRLYTDMVFQPMLELLAFLRASGFKTFIVSGGGVEFMRPWAERVYGIPPEQILGSSIKTKYEVRDGRPTIIRLPEVDFVDDKDGKPVAIQRQIGRRPLMAFGNSDGDLQMLQWTASGTGPRLCLLVHHTDAEREYQYDRQSPVGRLDKALDAAVQQGWPIVDMRRDWKRVFPIADSHSRAAPAPGNRQLPMPTLRIRFTRPTRP